MVQHQEAISKLKATNASLHIDDMSIAEQIEDLTHRFAKWAGRTSGFVTAFMSLIIWFIIGGLYHFSSDWESAVQIYIGIITFLMIFLMQRAQNKELSAVHLKLNELIAVTKDADNHLINAEELTEKEIKEVHEIHSKIVLGEDPAES